MRRILFVSYTADWTGPTNSLLQLVRGLKDAFEIHVVYPGDGELAGILAAEGVRGHSVPTLSNQGFFALRSVLKAAAPDLVYANNTQRSSRLAFLAALSCGVPFVSHVRGMPWAKGWSRLGYLWFARAVVAVSRASANAVSRFVRPGRLHVVYNGVPMEELAPAAEAGTLRMELGIGPEALLMVSVSHVIERKGQVHQIEVLSRVLTEHPDAHLAILGSLEREPAYVATLEETAERLGIEDRVHLVGFRRDAVSLLSPDQIFVHTAVADPHPRAVIEAMARALPVVAFAVDGVAETVVDTGTGRLVEPLDVDGLAEAVSELASNPDLCRDMGQRGRERVVAEFGADATTRGVKSIIENVLR